MNTNVFKTSMHKFYIVIFLSFLFSFSNGAYADADGAKNFVKSISDKVLAVVKDKSLSDSQKEKELTNIFQNSVDAKWMGRFAMGKYFRQASGEEQSKYLKLYNEFLIHSYVPRFREYTSEEFKISDVKAVEDGQVMVQTELVPQTKDAPAIRVDYRIKSDAGIYKVIDVVGEGVSLITTQRSDFGGMISSKGVPYFISKLEERVKNLKLQVASNGGKS